MKTVRLEHTKTTPKKNEVPCPVCAATKFKTLYEPWVEVDNSEKLYGAATSIPGTQTIVTCQDCGMIYENPRFDEDVILRGYGSSEESGHDSQFPMRVNSFYRSLKSLSSHLPAAPARVLDVGTAGGAFLDAAIRYGYQAEGLEPSLFLAEQGRKRGLTVHHGTLESFQGSRAAYDLITLWDVLEHVVNPAQTLKLLRPLLKPSGTILINYPDIGTWQAKLAGKRFWWSISGHLHYFSRHTLRELGTRNGFEVFHFQRYWQTLEFGYLERMAMHYHVPLSGVIESVTPGALKKIPVPYYASQTTALLRAK